MELPPPASGLRENAGNAGATEQGVLRTPRTADARASQCHCCPKTGASRWTPVWWSSAQLPRGPDVAPRIRCMRLLVRISRRAANAQAHGPSAPTLSNLGEHAQREARLQELRDLLVVGLEQADHLRVRRVVAVAKLLDDGAVVERQLAVAARQRRRLANRTEDVRALRCNAPPSRIAPQREGGGGVRNTDTTLGRYTTRTDARRPPPCPLPPTRSCLPTRRATRPLCCVRTDFWPLPV